MGLIVGLSLGGVALLAAVVAIVVLSAGDEPAKPPPEARSGNPETGTETAGLTNPSPMTAEPQPFHDEGLHEIGPLVREEIKLSNARFMGFAKTQVGLPFATWRLDYEFRSGGFQPSMLRDAYELRVRGSKLEKGNNPQERAWTIRHPGNQAIYSEREAGVQMLEPQGTVEVTWVIPQEDFAPPYSFWVYRKNPESDEFFLRVSRYTAADGQVQP